jgi:DNA-binding NarL/FixJ family response regulator
MIEKKICADDEAPALLLVEGNEFIRARLHDWFSCEFPRFRFLEAGTYEEARTLAFEYSPRVALVDIDLPDAKGFDILRMLRGVVPDAHTIALSMYHADTYRHYAESAGAIACLSLHLSDSMLRNLVGVVLSGAAQPKRA